MSDYEMKVCIQNLIELDDKIISKLKELLKDAEKQYNDCNIAKTFGTSVNTVATVSTITGICLAPFTVGASLILTVGGIAGGVTGSLINIGTDICDKFLSKRYMENISSLAEEHDQEAKKLDEFTDGISKIMKTLQNEGIVLNAAKTGGIKISSKVVLSFEAHKAMKAAGVISAIKSTGSSFILAKDSASMKFVLGKPVAELTKAESIGIANFMKSPGLAASKSVTKMGLQGVLGIVQIGFTVWEITDLVKRWKKEPPTAKSIDDFIEKLQEEKRFLNSFNSL